MANTLRQLAGQVRRLINKGDVSSDFKLGEREVMMLVRQIGYNLLKQDWYNLRNAHHKAPDAHIIVTFEKDVIEDKDMFNNYALLPYEYMSLPDNSGVYEVIPKPNATNQEPDAMIPLQPFDRNIIRKLPVGALEQQWCYEPRNDKLIFYKKSGKTLLQEKINKVLISVATLDPYHIEPDDAFPVPPEMQYQLLQEALKTIGFSNSQVKDMMLNENPNVATNQG